MLRKSLSSGLLIGLLLVLTLGQVVIQDQMSRLSGGRMGGLVWLPQEVLRTFLTIVAALALLFAGTLAAMRARVRRPVDGLKAGALSGAVAGLLLHLCLASLAVIRGSGSVLPFLMDPDVNTDLLQRKVLEAAVQTAQLSISSGLLLPFLGALLGGVEGFLWGLLRRAAGRGAPAETPEPTLLDLVHRGRPFRRLDREEHVLRAGLLGGVIVGGFLALASFLLALQAIGEQLGQWSAFLARRANLPDELQGVLAGLAGLAGLLTPIAILLWGGSGVLLLKLPPSRFRSRIVAGLLSGATAGAIFAALVGLTLVNVALIVGVAIAVVESGVRPTPAELRADIRSLLLFYPLIPFFQVLLLSVMGFLFGLPFALITPFTWPRRPVDRAAGILRRLRREPDTLLPLIYGLFQKDRQAVAVLEHLTEALFRSGERARSTVVAAYHTLRTRPEQAADTLKAIHTTLADAPSWRWRTEIGELHRFLEEGLRARNIHHLSAIALPPQNQTSSLPAALTQARDYLAGIVAEIKKGHRLDDPNSRSIYLNRALEEVTAVEQFVAEEMNVAGQGRLYCATPYAEQQVLLALLPHWREILHETLRDLRGRAALQVELLSRQATYMPSLRVRLQVRNSGLNVAEQVRIGLEPSADYLLTEQSEARIEILPPNEERTVELTLEPRNPRRLRLLLHIFFNDAVDENRELALADEVVFVETERPFQRIFPIPYITGTPLKTEEMFFGREDVFEYIREHLLGAYQNNIIVLHGQRRTGKTSVLYQLRRVLAESHYAVLLDMQGVTARNEAEFFYGLSDEIAYALEQAGLAVETPSPEAFSEQPEFAFRSRFLRPLYPLLGEKSLLLMFDEFEELQRHVEEGHLRAGLFPFLRNLMQHEEKVDFVFAGTHKLEELAAEYWSILFNIATYKKISFLEKKEVERLVTEPVAPYGMEYDPLAVEQIYKVTAGHPFLTQVVCHELVAYHNDTERSYITVTDVDAVLERIAERGEAHFKYIWAEAEAAEQAVLLAMAEWLAHQEHVFPEEIRALSERRGRPLSREAVLAALGRLESRDVVARTAPGAERFRFRVDLVRRWIGHNPQLAEAVVFPKEEGG